MRGWKQFRVSLLDMQHVMQSCLFFLQGYTNTNVIILINCSDLPGLTFPF